MEDIEDASDEERPKQTNIFQIRSSVSGATVQGAFTKNFSEHDFLVKDHIKVTSFC